MSAANSANPTVDAEGHQIKVGDVVQLNPEADPVFGGCLMIVEELQGWGVQCYVAAPAPDGPALYYYRVESANFRRIGQAEYLIPEEG